MNIKTRVDRIEKIIEEQKGITLDDLSFPGWTKEELANYVINGIKPEGKSFGHVSDRAYNHSLCERFDGWTNEDLTRYALTGEKPQKPAPSAH